MLFAGVFIFFTSFAGVINPAAGLFPSAYCPAGVVGAHDYSTWSCAGFVFTLPNADSSQTFLAAGTLAANANQGLMTLGGIMILGGAAGKSAQFPLHTWLPDAMEGPTTVSALIHAATMVAAGVFLLAITSIYLGFTVDASLVILGIGGFTALFAGTMGLVSRDIKRVIAYSTMSQLGYMTMAVGAASLVLASGPGAAMYQLFTHAFFKALLFLCAGSLIHAVGTQDLFAMGGLLRKMPLTGYTMLIGAMALSGFPPFSGFFSKDTLISLTWSATSKSPYVLPFFILAMTGVFLTALYIFRLWFLAFSGDKFRGGPDVHAHEPSWKMTVPLVALAGMSVVAGFLPLIGGFDNLLPGLSWGAMGYGQTGAGALSLSFSSTDLYLGVASLALALSGLFVAYLCWGNGKVFSLPKDSAWRAPQNLLVRKYYFDDAYDGLAHGVILGVARAFDWFDRYVVDGTIHGFERLFEAMSEKARRAQTGLVSSYASWIILGLILILAFFIYGAPHLSQLWGGG
jgi:NADH-quinone oxidoreductase subunit L